MILFHKSLLCSWYPTYVYAEKYSCKLDAVLYFAWEQLSSLGKRGITILWLRSFTHTYSTNHAW